MGHHSFLISLSYFDLLPNHDEWLLSTVSRPETSTDLSVDQMFVNVLLFVGHELHILHYLIHSYKLTTCNFTRIGHITGSLWKKKVFKKTCVWGESNSECIEVNGRNLVVRRDSFIYIYIYIHIYIYIILLKLGSNYVT